MTPDTNILNFLNLKLSLLANWSYKFTLDVK